MQSFQAKKLQAENSVTLAMDRNMEKVSNFHNRIRINRTTPTPTKTPRSVLRMKDKIRR